MRAIGFKANRPVTDADCLLELDMPDPVPRARDLVVRVEAVSVNPRDVKTRLATAASDDKPVVAGYDAAGTVVTVGAEATLFRPGDRVFYAGVVNRPGSNAALQAVDERIVGRWPAGLDAEAAASLPLTALTAWEMLFDRLEVPQTGEGGAVLMVGGAGGVPSIGIQLLRALTGVTVIGTASRPESERWVREQGAHHVINHREAMAAQVKALGVGPVGWMFSTHTDQACWEAAAALLAPQGRFGLIDDPAPLDLRLFKPKSLSIHWEAMFTRPMFGTADMGRQGDILNQVAGLVEAGRLRPTASRSFGPMSAQTLRAAHAAIEEDRVIGKITLSGFA